MGSTFKAFFLSVNPWPNHGLKALPIYSSKWCIVLQTNSFNILLRRRRMKVNRCKRKHFNENSIKYQLKLYIWQIIRHSKYYIYILRYFPFHVVYIYIHIYMRKKSCILKISIHSSKVSSIIRHYITII